jgi:ABC-2 type transport system permease protein
MNSDFYLMRNAWRDVTRPKRLVTAAILVALPALIAVFVRFVAPSNIDSQQIYNMLMSNIVFGFLLAILAVIFGTGVISSEIEQKTIVYLLTRPVPRWRIVMAKFVVAIAAIAVTLCLATFALAMATVGPGGLVQAHFIRDMAILAIGSLAYGALFLLLATIVNRPLLWGLLYAFGIETWAPLLPGKFQLVSLMAYLRTLAPHAKTEDDFVDVQKMMQSIIPDTISRGLAWSVIIGVILIATTMALVIFSKNEYVPREDAE